MTRTAVVCGAGGFIGSHLVKRLKREGYWAFPAAAISAACHQASPATITICRRENLPNGVSKNDAPQLPSRAHRFCPSTESDLQMIFFKVPYSGLSR